MLNELEIMGIGFLQRVLSAIINTDMTITDPGLVHTDLRPKDGVASVHIGPLVRTAQTFKFPGTSERISSFYGSRVDLQRTGDNWTPNFVMVVHDLLHWDCWFRQNDILVIRYEHGKEVCQEKVTLKLLITREKA